MKSSDVETAQQVQPDTENGLGRGLCFFPRPSSPSDRRRRYVFLAAWIGISSLLVWPVYPFFAAVKPLIAGLPLSLAWVLLAMVLMCVSLLWLFLGDEHGGGPSNG